MAGPRKEGGGERGHGPVEKRCVCVWLTDRGQPVKSPTHERTERGPGGVWT